MAKLEEKLNRKISDGLSDSRISPAVLAYHMLRENKYANESLIQYFINYVVLMSDTKLIPIHLDEVQRLCKVLRVSLEELGLTGEFGKQELDTNAYLAV
jgi:hypothetical protein